MNAPADNVPSDLLCCPRCAGAFARGAVFACSACAAQYSVVDGLPWLFPDSGATIAEWRTRLRALTAQLEAQAAHYRVALTDEVPRPSTRSRLKLLAGACQDHARRLQALLAPLELAGVAAARETYQALGPALAAGQGLTSYYANLHRDWGWDGIENELAYAAVNDALGPGPLGRTLVPGAGAGRLAYDLHARRAPEVLIAADHNPLSMGVARRVCAGEAVELYEFPVAPRDVQSNAMLRRLRAPSAAGPGLHFVLADVTCAPFAAGAFDTVITPWLVDILDEDLATFARRIAGWLKPGGTWVSSGSLFFQDADPARGYATEEVLAIVADAGFDTPRLDERTLPYLASPASRHQRHEVVVTFSARRTSQPSVAPARRREPAWLERNDVPVPLLPAVASRVLSMRVYAYVASLVDGRRSLRDIAAVLVNDRLMAADEAEAAVRGFLQKLHDEAGAPLRP